MAVVQASAADYVEQQQTLLPNGPAWPKETDSTSVRVFAPTAASLAVLHQRLSVLLDEADPRTTKELLVDWERVAGLPDPCLNAPQTLAEHRSRLVQRLTYQGGQSAAYFIGLLASLGYPGCTVVEYLPMRCNSKCNAALNQGGWRYGWRINVPVAVTVKRMTCISRCNEPLAAWGDPGLLCLLATHKPAHTKVFLSYGV